MMDDRNTTMAPRTRVLTTIGLLAGLALVFAGLMAALDFSAGGAFASAAVIVGLLYAGAVWFGSPAKDASAILFDRQLLVITGSDRGRPLSTLFPTSMTRELESRCRDALDGCPSRFSCAADPEHRRFEAATVRTADGAIAYGMLLSGAMLPALTREDVATVAAP